MSKDTKQCKFGRLKECLKGINASPPVDMRRSKTSLLNLPLILEDGRKTEF